VTSSGRGLPGRRLAALWRDAASLIGPGSGSAAADRVAASASAAGIVGLAVLSASALVLIALSHHLGQRQVPWSACLLWAGFALLYFPAALRVAAPATPRAERIIGLLLLGLCALVAKFLYAPAGFVHFDELLHVATARDILETRRLFEPNPLLPISPLYPGLELVVTAIVELTGLPLELAGNLVLLLLRGLLMCGLFAFYERVAGSDRIAAIACLAYVTNSGFVLFDAQFAYESLALVLFVVALLAASMAERAASFHRAAPLALAIAFLAALAVTHHMSAYFAAVILLILALLKLVARSGAPTRGALVTAAIAALLLPYLWAQANGNPGGSYLGPILERGGAELVNFLVGGRRREGLFTLPGGVEVPLALRIVSVASLALVSLALAAGFFRTLALAVRPEADWRAVRDCLRLRWSNPWLVLLALVAVGFPVSIGFRLTSAGWEIGNRMGPFVYLGVGMVAAMAITRAWNAPRQPIRGVMVAAALTIAFVGGINTGWGVTTQRRGYMVSADAASVEPMGIEAAAWVRDWLGPGNRFAADRVNRALLASHGRQRIVTSLFDDVDSSHLFLATRLSAGEFAAIRRGRIDYILVDLRLSTALPMLGHYYENNEYRLHPELPADAEALLKFNGEPGIDRVFDNGAIVVFGMRGVRDAR